ncbi:MAG: bifunctional nuclease family protein, partial [Verrucomicrobiae bacterium]|nr:bifunctional nuclease family protein [Verrucomicrobiae bacterium]
EIDARPSDCIALALQQKCPIYCAKDVFEEVEDMTEVLKQMSQGGEKSLENPFDEEDEPPPKGKK